jgi:hypothetical protein
VDWAPNRVARGNESVTAKGIAADDPASNLLSCYFEMPQKLDAVREEGTPVLPGLGSERDE